MLNSKYSYVHTRGKIKKSISKIFVKLRCQSFHLESYDMNQLIGGFNSTTTCRTVCAEAQIALQRPYLYDRESQWFPFPHKRALNQVTNHTVSMIQRIRHVLQHHLQTPIAADCSLLQHILLMLPEYQNSTKWTFLQHITLSQENLDQLLNASRDQCGLCIRINCTSILCGPLTLPEHQMPRLFSNCHPCWENLAPQAIKTFDFKIFHGSSLEYVKSLKNYNLWTHEHTVAKSAGKSTTLHTNATKHLKLSRHLQT